MRAAEFKGRHVYVVGGSMGIGLAVAKQVAALGADVTIFARHKQSLESAVREIGAARSRASQRVAYRQMDVTDRTSVLQATETAVAELGAPDVLINCAGRAIPRPFEAISYEQFVATMGVNLSGCWSTVSALLPHMKKRGGYIVNTASIVGLIGVFGYTDYCAAKFAVVGFSEALRSELKAHNITVSVLCPPDTDTPGFAAENQTKPEETRAIAAGASVMSPDAVARALIRGMGAGSLLIIPGAGGRLGVLAKRLFPGLVERLMDRTIRQVARRRSAVV